MSPARSGKTEASEPAAILPPTRAAGNCGRSADNESVLCWPDTESSVWTHSHGHSQMTRARPTTNRLRRLILVCAAIAATTSAEAQGFPFSQRGSTSQTVAFTELTVTYGRPVARGRALFGALVPWDSVWHPGADSATVLRISHDVLMDGHPVVAGEYSLWLIPRAQGAWTLILNRQAHVFHKPYPGAGDDALRLDVQPAVASPMESLAIYFPQVLRDEADLRVHWGTSYVSVRIKAPYRPA